MASTPVVLSTLVQKPEQIGSNEISVFMTVEKL
jgi:hypothetical protein